MATVKSGKFSAKFKIELKIELAGKTTAPEKRTTWYRTVVIA